MDQNKKSKSKKERTKEKIFKTAILLFTEKGYENTTVQEITEKADVAKGTFFSHFPTKDSILTYLGEQRIELMKEWLVKDLAYLQSAKEKIIKLFEVLAQVNEEDKIMTKLISYEILKKMYSTEIEQEAENQLELKLLMEQIIKEGQQNGEFTLEFQPNQVADILIGIYFFILLRWLSKENPPPLADEYKDRLSIVMGGITVDKR